jgi:hypothetical protein
MIEELGNIVAIAIPLGEVILQSDAMTLRSEACLGVGTLSTRLRGIWDWAAALRTT